MSEARESSANVPGDLGDRRGWVRSLAPDLGVFAGAAVVVVGLVHGLVPRWTGVDPFVAWMVLTIPLLWVPLAVAGGVLLGGEGWTAGRLRLRRLDGRGWRLTLAALVVMVAASGVLGALATALGLEVDPFQREPKAWTQGWVFAVWVVYWPLNILVEELVWRGVILPRMERVVGGMAWAVNAAAWALFHVGFGPGNVLVVLPTLVLIPLVCQRTGSTWPGIVLHVAISLPGMVAIALGVM